MGIEIERKFLLASDGWRAEAGAATRIRQGYFDARGASLRVRIAGAAGRLNIKSCERGAARSEYEYPIPLEDARQMLDSLCLPAQIDKVRHLVRRDGLLWEIDEFFGDNAGLRVAEVELDHIDQHIARPPWLGVEVTELSRYYNAALISHPYSRWSDAEREPPC